MGWGLWDGKGRTPTGGAVVTYEITRRLSRFFNCDMIFETSNRDKIGKIEDIDAGFRRRFVIRPDGLWHLEEDFLKDYDLIHIWDRAPIFTYRACTQRFLPHCHTLHSAASMGDWIRIASAFFVPKHDMIALGSRCLSEALSNFWEVPIEIIPYGVDADFFKPMDKYACREYFNIPQEYIVLGYLGRPSKLDFLLAYDIFIEVKRVTGRDDLILVVAGGRRKIRSTYVAKDFLYLGYLEKSEVPAMLNACDVFFNPVTGIHEGFGLTVVEAMSCGLPVVTTSWNGYRDTVTRDAGFLARTCWKDGDIWINQEDLVSACARLVKDEGLREMMSREARRRVEEKYKWEYCIEKYMRRFLDLIQMGLPEKIPYSEAPEKIHIRINGKTYTFSLEEAFRKIDEIRVDFQGLYDGFVSNKRMVGSGWRRFVCIDNIVNLPKYRWSMKEAIEREEERLKEHLPKLVQILKGN